MKPVLFVTGHVPPDRAGAFARLHELEGLEVALFGGRSRHGPAELQGSWAHALAFPHRQIAQHEAARLAAARRYRAVVCSTGGRVALGATWAGARAGRAPLIVWASLWAHPRSAAHALSYLPLRRLYRSADAAVAYGPHVADYLRAKGARNVHVAPQSVDNEFWSAPLPDGPRTSDTPDAPETPGAGESPGAAGVRFLFAGRAAREKGLGTLLQAWSLAGLRPPEASLVLVGVGARREALERVAGQAIPAGVLCLDPVPPVRLRELYADSHVLVVPSIPTRTFREPWGLVVNEAMNRGLAVIASDAVGAAAGGLVQDARNGLVVAAGDAGALAGALARLAGDAQLRSRMGAAGREDVRAYSHDAWAAGFADALASLGLSRSR